MIRILRNANLCEWLGTEVLHVTMNKATGNPESTQSVSIADSDWCGKAEPKQADIIIKAIGFVDMLAQVGDVILSEAKDHFHS